MVSASKPIISASDSPWDAPWPANELENLATCPICLSAERKMLHDELVDDSFYCAPGKWTLWRCSGCGSAYLDPRPSPASIHLAYKTYYTHGNVQTAERSHYAALSPFRKLRRQLLNGYTNWRFSAREAPALAIGALAVWAARPLKIDVDRNCRHLPRLPESGGAILDVGCGNGSFLQLAASFGWRVL